VNYPLQLFKVQNLTAWFAQCEVAYQAAQTLTSIGTTLPAFALFNKAGNGLPIWVLSARICNVTAVEVDMGLVSTDPALGAGGTVSNLFAGTRPPGATWEAATVASPVAIDSYLNQPQVSARAVVEYIWPGIVILPPGKGMVIQTIAEAVDTLAVTVVWAEPSADMLNQLALLDL
jgi:hypothetical protein